jgi:zinc/manganese transport system substrate-binding protein
MVKMRNADLVISQGLELESAWLNSLITGARNPKINSSTPGNLELGPLLEPIEIPKGDVSRAQGDVHPGGNPHFQIDPVRMGNAAMLIAQRMSELDHENAKLYTENSKNFQAKMAVKTKEWQKRLDKTGIKQVVTYHKTLSYFLDRFGIKGVMELEPKPGIPPTASHLLDVIATIKKDNIKLVLIENYFEDSVGEKLKKDIPDLTVVRVPASVGGSPEIKSTEDLIENLVKVFEAAKK